MRYFVVIRYFLFLAVLVFAAGLYWLLNTESGLRFIANQGEKAVPGLQLGEVTGTVLGPLSLASLDYEQAGQDISLSSVRLNWKPLGVLRGHLLVEELTAQSLSVVLPESNEPPTETGPVVLPSVEMPISVEILNLGIRQVSLQPGGNAEPLVIDDVVLAAEMTGSDLQIHRLKAHNAQLDAAVSCQLKLSDDWPVAAEATWQLRLPELEKLDGVTGIEGKLAGAEPAISLNHESPSPWGLQAVGKAVDPVNDLRLELSVTVRDSYPVKINKAWPVDGLRADLQINGPPSSLSLKGLISANLSAEQAGGEARELVMLADLVVAGEQLQINQLVVEEADLQTEVVVAGDVALAEQSVFDVVLEWNSLQWPLAGTADFSSERGRVAINGPLAGYTIKGGFDLQTLLGPKMNFTLNGKGTAESLETLILKGREKDGEAGLAFSGKFRWAPELAWQGLLTTQALNPGWVDSRWPGAVNAKLQTQGTQTASGLSVDAEIVRLDGQLRGYDLNGQGKVTVRDGDRVSGKLGLQSGNSVVTAEGKFAPSLDMAWTLKSPDLKELYPAAKGQLAAEGQLAGQLPNLKLAAMVSGNDLGFEDNRIAKLSGQLLVDLASANPAAPLNNRFTLEGIQLGEMGLDSLTLNTEGALANHRLTIALSAEDTRLDLGFSGAVESLRAQKNSPNWRFSLDKGDLTAADLPAWQLTKPAKGKVSAQHFEIEESCWTAASASWCWLANWQAAQDLRLNSELNALPLAWLGKLLPGLRVSGELSGKIDADWPLTEAGNPVATARLSLTGGAIEQRLDEEWVAVLDWEHGKVEADLDAQTASAKADIKLVDRGGGGGNLLARVNADLAAVGTDLSRIQEAPLAGSLNMKWNNLQLVPLFFPAVVDLDGVLSADLKLAGVVGNPTVNGQFNAKGKRVVIAETGLILTALDAVVMPNGRDFEFRVDAVADGKLSVTGNGRWDGSKVSARAKVQGDRFQAVNTIDARVWLSPDIEVSLADDMVRFGGKLVVPKARITPREISGVSRVSSDQVIVNQDVAQTSETQVRGDLDVSLGNDVRFEGFGLKAKLGGQLKLLERPGQLTRGRGDIVVEEGSYQAFGQNLQINQGRLLFNGGPITAPALDLRATREAQNVIAGVYVRGTLEKPDLKLFSEPPLPQTDALAYLVLGRPLTSENSEQADALQQAALALQLKGTEFVANRVANRLGIEDIGIQSGGDNQTAQLVLGKYLTPKLYVSYGVGVFETSNRLLMRYIFSDKWKAEATSTGEASGGDIYYTIESGSVR